MTGRRRSFWIEGFGLVPIDMPVPFAYEKLPEHEKEYDRNTALETLKAVIVLVYIG